MDIDGVEITDEMKEAVALAILYREDPILALRKVDSCPKKISNRDLNLIYNKIRNAPDFEELKNSIKGVEAHTLVEDDMDTIMLMYNKMLRDATTEKKYDVIIRILKEIRQIKAIEDEQTKFEVVIRVLTPEEIKEMQDDKSKGSEIS